MNQASLEKGILSLASLGKETVRGLMVHAMVEVMSFFTSQIMIMLMVYAIVRTFMARYFGYSQ